MERARASNVERAEEALGRLFVPPRMRSSTVNHIDTPDIGGTSLLVWLYAVMAFIGIVAGLTLKLRGEKALIPSFLISFVAGGILFSAIMDGRWLLLWRHDSSTLGQMSVERRLALINDKFPIAQELKRHVPPDGRIRIYARDSAFKMRLRYYALPIRVSGEASYLVVSKDSRIKFDPSGRTLRRKNIVVADQVIKVSDLGGEAALFKTLSGGAP